MLDNATAPNTSPKVNKTAKKPDGFHPSLVLNFYRVEQFFSSRFF